MDAVHQLIPAQYLIWSLDQDQQKIEFAAGQAYFVVVAIEQPSSRQVEFQAMEFDAGSGC